jgi:hypothetical protein
MGRAILLLLAIFASGAAVGGFGVSLYKTHSVSAATSAKEWRQKYVSTLSERLHLNADQVTHLNNTLDETRSRYDDAKARHKVEMDRIHDEQVAKMRSVLDPNQAVEYDRFREERDRERRKAQQQQQAQASK